MAQNVTGDGDESAATIRGGGFANYALVSLHCLRIYLDTTYRMTINLLKEMPQILRKIGLKPADLPAPSTLCKALDRIEMSLYRVQLRQSAQLHDPSEHATLDATFYDRDRTSHHYCHRTNYHVQTLKVTKLADTESQAVLNLHYSTTYKGSDADLCGFLLNDWTAFFAIYARHHRAESGATESLVAAIWIRKEHFGRVPCPSTVTDEHLATGSYGLLE